MAKIKKIIDNAPKSLEDYKALAKSFVSNEDTEARVKAHHSRIANAIQQWGFLIACPTAKSKHKTIPKTREWLNSEMNIPIAPRKVKVVAEPISTTKKLEFLGERMGENAPTALTVRGAWKDEYLPLLKEEIMCCVNSDFDMLIPCNKWGKLTFTVQSWMTHEKFGDITMKWFLAAGGSLEWSESAWNRLNNLGFAERYAVCKLVNSTPRTPKRKELKSLFLAWMEGADVLGPYDLRNICDDFTMREAKSADTRCYWRSM